MIFQDNGSLEIDYLDIKTATEQVLKLFKKAQELHRQDHDEKSRSMFNQAYELWGDIEVQFRHLKLAQDPQLVSQLSTLIDDMEILKENYYDIKKKKLEAIQKDPCSVQFFWGHGSDVSTIIEGLKFLDYQEFRITGQGCMIGLKGNVQYRRDQRDSNGTWMGDLARDYNGGLNPRMTPGLDPNLRVSNLFQETEEKSIMKQFEVNAAKYPDKKKFLDKSIGKINAVGFMKLTQFNWMGSLLEAESLAITSKCSMKTKVPVYFNCWEDMDNSTFKSRYNKSIDHSLSLKDGEDRPVEFQKKECGSVIQGVKEDGTPITQKIYSTPEACYSEDGNRYKVDLSLEDIKSLKSGPCSSLFKEVIDSSN